LAFDTPDFFSASRHFTSSERYAGSVTLTKGILKTIKKVSGAGKFLWGSFGSDDVETTFAFEFDGKPAALNVHLKSFREENYEGAGNGVVITMWDTVNNRYWVQVMIPFEWRTEFKIVAINYVNDGKTFDYDFVWLEMG